MANKPLQSIKFPGLSDTYIVPQIDDTLSVEGRAADAASVGTDINKRFALATGQAVGIPKNSDLDDYVTAGNYRVNTVAISKTIANIPVQMSGRLMALTIQDVDTVFQTYITAGGTIFTRIKSVGVWKEWKNITSQVTTDTTLSISGTPADAKATGAIADSLSNTEFVFRTREVVWEQGSMSSSTGEETETDNVIRTGYLKFDDYPVTINASDGYNVGARVFKNDFSFYRNIIPADSQTFSNPNYYIRLVVMHDSTRVPTSPSEASAAIASGMEGARQILPSRKLDDNINVARNAVNALEGRVADLEASDEFAKYNLNIPMPDNTDMMFEYQNWIFPEAISYNKIRNRLYFTFTSKAGYGGVAQYDFDTGKFAKTVLKQNTNKEADDHDPLACLMLSTSRLLCAYSGGHGADRYMYIRRADTREGIEFFGDVVVLECSGATTYAQMFEYDNKIYLFYRLSNTQWAYRIGTGSGKTYGTVWSGETILINFNAQIYCQFAETTTPGVLRVCCYTNPSASDTSIRMAYLHLDTMTLYDIDNVTALGNSNIDLSNVSVIIAKPTSGKVNRLFNAAKTAINDNKILYCEFTNTADVSDGIYYVYDNGNRVKVADAGMPFWNPKYQLGVHWIGSDKIVVGRGDSTDDKIEIYDYLDGVVSFNKLVVSQRRVSHGVQFYRTGRPIVDNNQKVILYFQGFYNHNMFTDFTTDAHIYDIENDKVLL